ncbi:MAG TPA: hypothetical protein VHG70_16100 [Nocardioidaceae bacterium]|nr:hypothetical protein [Nocardioidaceae bacterium]
MPQQRVGSPPRAFTVTILIFVATVGQLLVATFATDLPQFAGKGFGARLVAYPLLMLLVPAGWFLLRRLRPDTAWASVPWTAFALIMAPFLVDVTGNTLNLYDSVVWWDDANHFANWFLLCSGIGLLLMLKRITPAWAVGMLVAGIGAVLALGWELGEWYTFIRHGTELATAYEDTLADQALGTAGAVLAGVLVVGRLSASAAPGPSRPAGSGSFPRRSG